MAKPQLAHAPPRQVTTEPSHDTPATASAHVHAVLRNLYQHPLQVSSDLDLASQSRSGKNESKEQQQRQRRRRQYQAGNVKKRREKYTQQSTCKRVCVFIPLCTRLMCFSSASRLARSMLVEKRKTYEGLHRTIERKERNGHKGVAGGTAPRCQPV